MACQRYGCDQAQVAAWALGGAKIAQQALADFGKSGAQTAVARALVGIPITSSAPGGSSSPAATATLQQVAGVPGLTQTVALPVAAPPTEDTP